VDVILGAAALDHVAGQRVGRAAEADDAEAVAEVRGDFLDGAGDVGQVVGAIGAQGADVFGGADGMVDHGASPAWNSKGRPMGSRAAAGRQR
jgi:hypothetical protein